MMQKTENPMGYRPIFPLLMSMAVPPMVSMLIQSLYNIVDSIFVAKMGQDALTAVSLAFPLQNLVLASAVGLGVGVNASMASGLGAKNWQKVNDTAAHGMIFTAIHSIVFVLIGLFLTKPFLSMFTQNDEILQMGSTYSYIVICLSFGSQFHIMVEKMFQATGSMVVPMIMQAVGAVINIILDPILIFGLFGMPAMGVAGAAVATIIGQFSACILAFAFFFHNSGGIHLSIRNFKFRADIAKKIYMVAVPSAIMMSLPSLLVGILNHILVGISQGAVAVFGLYYKVQTFVYMPTSGVVQGMRPIISYNYGAGHNKRLLDTIKMGMLTVGTIMIGGTILFLFFPRQIMDMFSATEEMAAIGVPALQIISVGFVMSTISVILSGAFEALGKGFESLGISLLRQMLLIPPLAILFSASMGLSGVWITFPISEFAAAIVAILLFRRMQRSFLYLKEESEL